MDAAADGLFAREAELGAQLRALFDAERYAEFQSLLEAAINRLGELRAPHPRHLAYLLHFAERACLDDARVAELLARTRPALSETPELRTVWGAVAARRRFRAHVAESLAAPFTLVPLGLHCLPWTLGNRWGFRTRAAFGTTLNPFCLAIHKPATVIEALRTGFAGYCDPATLRLTSTPRGHRIAMRADGGAVWNHNRNDEWLRDGFRPLVEGMARKADAFRASAREEDAVFLLADAGLYSVNEPVVFLPALREALAVATGRPDARLIVTAQPRGGTQGETWLDRRTAVFVLPYPTRDYTWADETTADSAEGLRFERGYATAILRCLHRWGIARREAKAA